MKGSRWVLALALVAAASLVFGPGARLLAFAFSAAKPGSREITVVEVHKGERPSEIAGLLFKSSLVSDASEFVLLGRVMRRWGHIKAGEYGLSPGQTPIELFSVITSGVSMAHPITVREGENIYEIASEIGAKNLTSKDRFLALCHDRRFIESLGLTDPKIVSLEGYLYPDTYFFNRENTPEEMLHRMVRHFLEHWTADDDARAQALGMTRYQVVTLASIIEKETGAPDERPLISSIFHNRLKKHMRLQSDPTIIYGIWKRYDGNLHKRDMLSRTPYNTYVVPALPIGPIGNPGKDSIHAALYPAQSDYLYFVSHNDGTHAFSRNLAEHNAAVRKFQLDPKAREGKSWRDLYKREHHQ